MIIDKNLLDRSIFDIIVNKVLHSPWNFAECTGAEDVEDSSSFYMIISDENGICSPLYDLICLPLIVACAKNNIKITEIIRIRVGLIPKLDKQILHTPHVDYQFPHKTMLFYLTNSDAPTLMFDKKHSGNGKDKYWSNIESLKVEKNITPVENTFVIFDGLTFHSSTTPKDNPLRIVINYNFID